MKLSVSRFLSANLAALATLLLAPLGLGAAPENSSTVVEEITRSPAHSMHGEAFNNGPRRSATLYPAESVGNVVFPITTRASQAQEYFNQGVGMLHGFWFFEAERAFRQVVHFDPKCAAAYWGLALANVNNPKRARQFIADAEKWKESATPKERRLIEAWSNYLSEKQKDEKKRRTELVKALETLCGDFPDDIELKALLCVQLWENKVEDVPLGSYLAVDALAKQVLAVNPMHPVHHYIIHLWNYERDIRALPSAARVGQSAPGIAHMWHMSGHTFAKLDRHADAAWQQEASARVDHAYMAAQRVMPEQIHNYVHNNGWLVDSWSHIGRAGDAIRMARNLIEIPRIGPDYEVVGRATGGGDDRGGLNAGQRRLAEVLLRHEMWEETVQVRAANLLEPLEPDPVQDARNLRLYAFAALGRGNRSEAETFARSLELALNRAREERRKAGDEAEAKAKREKRDRKAVSTAMADALAGKSRPVEVTEAMLNQVRLELALTTGDIARARELADNLSEVPPDWVPRVWLRIGDFKKAEETARKAVSDNPGTVAPLASLVEVLWKAGKKDDAKTHFQTLRQLAAEAELWRPKLARLQPLALELGWPKDWRLARFHPRDAGIRPALDDLGPALWEPQLAPSFTLQDTTGKARTLAEFAGKPVVVLFYLGSGCAHCIEQLNAFAPFTKRFSEAGIELVAVSTDSAHNLNETFAKATDPGGFTFTVVGDPTLDAFKRYLAYDDLEQKALHGAYLIDAQGRVRWQEIGTAPFNEPEWLLGEARRLLGAPNSGKVAGTSTNL